AKSARVPKPSNLEAWDSPPTTFGFKGGDLLGVVEHLDDLVELGVNAIYFTPIFQSAANHRYHTHDYFRVDPMLGGDPALRELIDEAHRRGLRVVLDGVFNHASRGFFEFNHILENREQSPYLDWFHVRSYPLYPYDPENQPSGYDAWWGLKALPKFNTNTRAVREFILSVARHWINFGIDGWRLDVPNEIDDDAFWQEFRYVVKSANPDAYLVGEIWTPAERWLQGDQFDAVMNYQFTRACIEFFIGARGDPSLWSYGYGDPQPTDAAGFAQRIEGLLHRYAPAVTAVMLNLLGSHDTARWLTIARDDETSLRMATLMQMTYPGAPSIYYGDEIGMTGARDPANRGAMRWDEAHWNRDLRDYVKKCIVLRRLHPALRWGAFQTLYANEFVFVFARYTDDELFVVAFNAGDSACTVTIPALDPFRDGDVLRDVWSVRNYTVANRQICVVQVPPRTGMVLERVAHIG
ncbi:MAG: alpha-amylase, partial [Chloroflexi bacterium]|nr:alpha-amylase [Chloroflexota bacterium]